MLLPCFRLSYASKSQNLAHCWRLIAKCVRQNQRIGLLVLFFSLFIVPLTVKVTLRQKE